MLADLPATPISELTAQLGRLRPARHLLVVAADINPMVAFQDADEVEVLAASRFAAARWETLPQRGSAEVPAVPGLLRLSRYSALAGPYAPGPHHGLPGEVHVFDVVCPRERASTLAESSVDDGGQDLDGIAHDNEVDPLSEEFTEDFAAAFASGRPVREEMRVVDWLIAVAGRLHGAVIVDLDGSASYLTPHPDAVVELTLYSDVWLAPDAALATLREVDERAAIAPSGTNWAGPPVDIRAATLPGSVLDIGAVAALHERSDGFDIRALTENRSLDGYAIHLNLGLDGVCAVEIGGETALPLALSGLAWAENGAVAYRVRWFAAEPDRTADLTTATRGRRRTHYAAHAHVRAAVLVAALTAALHRVAGGEISDHAGFLIHPEDL